MKTREQKRARVMAKVAKNVRESSVLAHVPVERLLTLRDVMSITSLSRASIYRGMNAGTFPQSRRLTGGARVAWLSSDINDWQRDLPQSASKVA